MAPSLRTVLTKRGPVEFADDGPIDGPVVLTVHGSPGGSDQGRLMGGFLVDAGFRVVSPSRPGYLGTPWTPSVATPHVQAVMLADLMTELDIENFGVFSWSGGGPCGYRLAVEYPQRVRALVAFAALSARYEWRMSLMDRLTFGTSIGELLLKVAITRTPRFIVSGTLSSEGSLTDSEVERRTAAIMADPELRSFVLGVAKTAVMRGKRMVGVRNDALQFATMPSLDLPEIDVPTLVVHGDADSDVDPSFGRTAAARIPAAELLLMARGTHLALFVDPGYQQAQQRVCDFLSDD